MIFFYLIAISAEIHECFQTTKVSLNVQSLIGCFCRLLTIIVSCYPDIGTDLDSINGVLQKNTFKISEYIQWKPSNFPAENN